MLGTIFIAVDGKNPVDNILLSLKVEFVKDMHILHTGYSIWRTAGDKYCHRGLVESLFLA